MGWIHMAHGRVYWRVFVRTVKGPWGSIKCREFIYKLNEFQILKNLKTWRTFEALLRK
jgi:hypothetical protein